MKLTLFSAVATTVLTAMTAMVPPVGALEADTTQSGVSAAKPTIVLVHGAFADASGWKYVIPLLEKEGYTVLAVQNPLTSFAEDIAITKRAIDAQKGPVVVVGHSYGGAVITGAAAGSANVKALVYINAYAPEANEPIRALNEQYPTPARTAYVSDAAGFLTIDRAKFHSIFCADVPSAEARIMAATQKPLFSGIVAQSVPNPAWKTIPSWYMVGKDDQVISPDQERFYAKRMGATTREVASSHVPFLSQPKAVTELIVEAARAAAK